MSREAFGKTLVEQGVWEERIANARIDIEMTRLLCLKAADMMDRAGNKAAQGEIAMIKVAAPIMALKIIDDAIQCVWRCRRVGRCRPRARLCLDPHVAARGRAGRGSPACDCPAGDPETSMSEQAIDEKSLGAWLEANVEGFSGPFSLTKFPSGQSNPTVQRLPLHPVPMCCGASRSVIYWHQRTRLIANIDCFRHYIRSNFLCPVHWLCAMIPKSSAQSSMSWRWRRGDSFMPMGLCPTSITPTRRRMHEQLVDTLADLHNHRSPLRPILATSASRGIISSDK